MYIKNTLTQFCRYVNEWENNVNADGSVFFVKKHPQTEPFMEDIELNRDGSNQGNQSDKSTGEFLLYHKKF